MMKIHLVNVSDVDESMRMQLRMWRNSDAVSPFFLLDQVTEDQHQAWLERNIRGEDALACVIYADRVPPGIQGTAPGFRRVCADDGAGCNRAGAGTAVRPDSGE